jgi:hypothetical protein
MLSVGGYLRLHIGNVSPAREDMQWWMERWPCRAHDYETKICTLQGGGGGEEFARMVMQQGGHQRTRYQRGQGIVLYLEGTPPSIMAVSDEACSFFLFCSFFFFPFFLAPGGTCSACRVYHNPVGVHVVSTLG